MMNIIITLAVIAVFTGILLIAVPSLTLFQAFAAAFLIVAFIVVLVNLF